MSKKFIDLANLKSNLENFLSEIISPTFATKEGVSKQLGNHTVKSDVPENAVFTDTKDWESITGKPDSFPPSSHEHTISEITGLQDTLDGKASSDHTHDDRYYTETEVDTKLNKKAESIHNHTKSQITDFPTSMPANGGNADTVNSHTVKSDVPENAVFTDTVYDDTEVKGEVDEINSNLVLLAKSDKGASNNICGAYGKYYYPLSVGDVLTISKKDSSVSILESNMVRLNQYDANGNKVDYWQLHDNALPRTVTISKKSVYIGFNKDTTDTPLMVNVGSSAMAYEPYIPSNKTLAEENTQQSTEMMDIKMLGWSVPRECPIQNEVNGNQFIQKVGRVDLGSLNWIYDSSIPRFYSDDLQNFIKKVKSESDIFSGYLKDYNNLSLDNLFHSVKDKAIAESTNGTLSIVNLSYIDAPAFKSAMQEKYLYYELATYNTMTIDGNEIGETVSDVRKETTVNLLNPTLQTTTINGITCTNNGDGTYTLNGTSTASSNTNFVIPFSSPFKGKCKLIGCPSNIDSIAELQCDYNGVWDSKNTDHGKGSILDSTNLLTNIAIVIFPNVTVNNIVFKLMITTNLNATYDDFVPYTGDTGKLNSDVANIIKLQSTLGGKVDSSIYSSDSINLGRKTGTEVGKNSFACGNNVEASGSYSHAEGYYTKALGKNSHAEGDGTKAIGNSSHAEGYQTTASGNQSHAEGNSTAEGDSSHAEGCYATASGAYSHAEGYGTTASGNYSHAEGVRTTALINQHAQGHCNNTTTATANDFNGISNGTAFVIGNGTTSSASNAFRVTGEGKIYATNASVNTGADYAEYFEWSDGNPNNEDRVGYFVTFDNDNPEKIKLANSSDNYILGIVSGMPSIIGNGDEDWKKRYILDDFGRYIKEEFEYEIEEPTEELDEEGNIIFNTVKKTGTKWKENPDYDNTKEYTPRDQRQEWSAIGMLGVLSVYDDGTCEVNGFCKVSDGGIATKSEDKNDYRVISRLKDNIVRVIFR